MDADIRIFINKIREKTGIEFGVYNSEGDFVAGKGESGDTVPVGFEGICSDKNLNKTFFKI